MQENKVIFPVNYTADAINYSEALMNYDAINSGYTFPLDGLTLKYENFTKFMEVINAKFDPKLYDYSESARTIQKHYICDDFLLYVSGTNKNIYIEIAAKSRDITKYIFDVFKKFHSVDDEVIITMCTYFLQGGHINSGDKILSKEEINSISTDYYPYIDTDIMFKQFFSLQENILILTGAPGLGKSKMASAILKYASDNEGYLPYDKMEEHDSESQYVSVAYVKSPKVLADDQFWRELEMGFYDFVIMDDLDYFLTKRESEVISSEDQDRNQFLNQFLSFTDGIEKNRTKFIITTNQPFDDLDFALLRKGRLFDILELRPLKYDEALSIWKDALLEESLFAKLFSGDEILAADLGSEISKHTNLKVQDSLGSYLKEEGISRIQKAKKVKKVGV